MRKIIFFTILVSLVATAGFWSAKNFCALCFGPAKGQHFYSGLDIDSNQKQSVVDAEKKFRRYADQECMKICKLRLKVLDMLEDPNVEKSRLDSQIEEVGRLQTSLEKSVAAHVLEMRQYLTSAQMQAYLKGIRGQLEASIHAMGMNAEATGSN